MTITTNIPNWLKLVFLIVIGIIIVSLIRGCTNQEKVLADNKKLSERNATLAKKIESDSLDRIESEREYNITIKNQDGIISINENKWVAATSELNKANDRIDELLSHYKPVMPSGDTNITTVSNDYIYDCADCFTQLEGQQKRIKVVQYTIDTLKSSLDKKISTQQSRIRELGSENDKLQNNVTFLQDINSIYQDKLETRRRLYLAGGIKAINQYMPNAIGAGLAFQDKKLRIYSITSYGSKYGQIYDFTFYLPLSLRFIK